jgi:hypothetical protein
MKGNIMIGSFLILALFTFCQSNVKREDTIKKLVSELSWNSFEYHTTTYFTEIIFIDTSAKELMEIGRPATHELLQVIEDEEKGVITHLLLTKIWYPKKFKVRTEYVYEGEEIQKIIYTINNLNWSWVESDGNSVKKSDLKKVKEIWYKEVSKKYL